MKKGIALALTTLTLIGCGAGGSGDGHTAIQDRRIDGFWEGSVTLVQEDPEVELKLEIAIDTSHQAVWRMYEEDGNTTNNVFIDQCDMSRIGRSSKCTLTSALTIEGITHASELTLSGSGIISNVEVLTFNADLNENYDKEANLSNLVGTWSILDNTLALTFDEDGDITAQDGSACAYSGTAQVINTTKSLFNLNLEIETCNTLDGTYTGKLFYENTGDEDDPDETITLFLIEVGDDPENLQRFSLELDKN